MSLIEKIDELEKYLVKNNSYFEGAEWLFGKVREAILSEQKEPCEYCASGYVYYLQKDAKFCPMCGRPLNKEADTDA